MEELRLHFHQLLCLMFILYVNVDLITINAKMIKKINYKFQNVKKKRINYRRIMTLHFHKASKTRALLIFVTNFAKLKEMSLKNSRNFPLFIGAKDFIHPDLMKI